MVSGWFLLTLGFFCQVLLVCKCKLHSLNFNKDDLFINIYLLNKMLSNIRWQADSISILLFPKEVWGFFHSLRRPQRREKPVVFI